VLEGHANWVEGTLILPDGQLLSWSYDRTLRLWDAATGACSALLEGHTAWVDNARSLPDGRILSWSQDRTLRLWNATTGECRAVLEGHTDKVIGIRLLPDGRILSWSWDQTLRLWDAVTGACHAVLEGHTSEVDGALSLPDGRILSWSWDETLLWNAENGDCLEVVEQQDAADWLDATRIASRPTSESGGFFCAEAARTGSLCHRSVSRPVASWQADTDARARCLLPDGTLVLTQANGQVCFLKLFYGRRRITLADAEQFLAQHRGSLV
jgi:WD40 repeat protein